MANVVTPYEFEHLVSSLSPLELEHAGGEQWMEQAGLVERLSVGAVLQSGSGETEIVSRLMVDMDKLAHVLMDKAPHYKAPRSGLASMRSRRQLAGATLLL